MKVIRLDFFDALMKALAHMDNVMVQCGKKEGKLTYGLKGIFIYQAGKYCKITKKMLKSCKFYEVRL